jgi:phosphoadenosine phosphosulfate reductase
MWRRWILPSPSHTFIFSTSSLRRWNPKVSQTHSIPVHSPNNTLTYFVDVLRWCITSLPNLYQTTAFGLTGLVTLDMLSKISGDKPLPGLIFLDTLYHFDETHELIDRVRERYPKSALHIYKPENAATADEFEALHGQELWTTNEEQYDWLAKVEPAERAYRERRVQAVLTGRRRSQGGNRGKLDILEVTETGLIKVNPLAGWDFERVRSYIDEHNVPYNALLDRGYKSVGDWHSTQPVAEGEDERAGRWKGREKTECGIHNKPSRYAQFLMEMELKRQQEEEAQQAATEDAAVEPEPSAEEVTSKTEAGEQTAEKVTVVQAVQQEIPEPVAQKEALNTAGGMIQDEAVDKASEASVEREIVEMLKEVSSTPSFQSMDSANATELPVATAPKDSLALILPEKEKDATSRVRADSAVDVDAVHGSLLPIEIQEPIFELDGHALESKETPMHGNGLGSVVEEVMVLAAGVDALMKVDPYPIYVDDARRI